MKKYQYSMPFFMVLLVMVALLFEYHQHRKHQRRIELLALSSSQAKSSEHAALPFSAPAVPKSITEESVTADTGREPPLPGQFKININTASSLELQQLPGIGPARAQLIIEYRQQYGNFQNAEELLNITGIGEKTLQKIKNQLEL